MIIENDVLLEITDEDIDDSGCFVIPKGITHLCRRKEYFSRRDKLVKLIIPDGVTHIGSGFFSDCSSLVEVQMSDTVTYLGECAFERCRRLERGTLSKSLTEIYKETFYGCNISQIKIPSSVRRINDGAFQDCNLSNVILPENLEYIGGRAFSDNIHLKKIVLPANCSFSPTAFMDFYGVVLQKKKEVKDGATSEEDLYTVIHNGMYPEKQSGSFT